MLRDYIDYDVSQVKSVEFGILSPEKIVRSSVAHICNHIGKNKGDTTGTLLDPRLGASFHKVNEVTKLAQMYDPGNFGHLYLAKPVYHPSYFSYVKNIVSCVCPVCSYPRYKSDDDRQMLIDLHRHKSNADRYKNMVAALGKNATGKKTDKFCVRCKSVLPGIRENKSTNVILGLVAVFKEEKKELFPDQVQEILRNISDEECRNLGLNPKTSHPAWAVPSVIPIPPQSIRPSVQVDNGKTSEDDITNAYNVIIKQNNALQLAIERGKSDDSVSSAALIYRLWQTVQFAFASLIDNDTSAYVTATNRTHRPLKTFRQRHRGKPGRVRNNLMGKRANDGGRTVITGDPNLGINEVGVPIKIAMKVTFPQIVTKENYSQMVTLIKNGPEVYPGAKAYRAKNSKFRVDLSIKKDITPSIGDTVYRHILDGDTVYFNRQPSLRKESMMGHKAKVIMDNTFKFNPNVTPPYNADFDGDEMNMHFPQSEMTAYEVTQMAMVSTKVVSSQASKPLIGAVQDCLAATYRMTSEHKRGFKVTEKDYMNPRQFMRLVGWLNNYKGTLPKPLQSADGHAKLGWTTRQLFSMFLPNISLKSGGIWIKNGELQEPADGVMIEPIGKRLIGKSAAGGLFHICWNDLGHHTTRDLLDNFSRITSQWFLMDGFSVGMSDLEIRKQKEQEVVEIKKKYLEKTRQLIDALHSNRYDELREGIVGQQRGLAQNNYDQFENDMVYILLKCRSEIESLTAEELSVPVDEDEEVRDNRIKSMVDSGSKGSTANIVQIISILGQQDTGGGTPRVCDTYFRRPLPHIAKDDLSPESRGFISNPYLKGLSPIEYIFHAMAGRIGVISTSIKTADTGYLQRKLVKILEDIMIKYDASVRNAVGLIVQELYGGDGFDGARIEPQKLPYLPLADDEFRFRYTYHEQDYADLKKLLSTEAYTRFNEQRDAQVKMIEQEFKVLEQERDATREQYKHGVPEKVYCPINFTRLIKHTKNRLGLNANVLSDLTPVDVIQQVEETIQELRVIPNNPDEELDENDADEIINRFATTNFRRLMHCRLNSKTIILDEKFTQEALTHLLINIKIKFNSALIQAGTAAGLIAAQSIGEPSTQLTLDTFHQAGAGSKARGVPRLKEVVSAGNTKTPSVVIYLKREVVDSINVTHPETGDVTTAKQLDDELGVNPNVDKQYIQTQIVAAVKSIKSQFDYLIFKDIVNKTEILYTENDDVDEDDPDYGMLQAYYQICPDDPQGSPWVIRFEINRDKMADHRISTVDLEYIFNTDRNINDTVQCIFSDDNSDSHKIICRARVINVSANPIEVISVLEENIMNIRLKGIRNINKTSIRTERSDIKLPNGAIISKFDGQDYSEVAKNTIHSDEYVIETFGTNLIDILNMPYVDTERTFTNDIREIYEVYGIEGARQAIINEMMEILGDQINIRHVSLLADIMTARGILQSVDRFGVSKSEAGPWARASFEQTTPEITKATLFNEKDNMKGVSANVMFGNFVEVGTNSFKVELDEKKLSTIKEDDVPEVDLDDLLNQDTTGCEVEKFKFDFEI